MIRLEDAPLFKGLAPETAAAISGIFITSRIQAGEVVFSQGKQGNALVVVLEGIFELVRDGEDGQEIHLADVEPGRVLGLTSLVDPGPRTATLKALDDGELAILDRDTFMKLWDAQGDAAAQLHFQLAVIAIGELRSAYRKLMETVADPLQVPAALHDRIYQAGLYR